MGTSTAIHSSIKLERAKGDSTFVVKIDGLSTEGLAALSEYLSIVGEVSLDDDKIVVVVKGEEAVVAQTMVSAYNQAKLWAMTLSDNMKSRYVRSSK